jgi:hypothetical protein
MSTLRCLALALVLMAVGLAGTSAARAQDGAIGLIISVVDCETVPAVNPNAVCEPNAGTVLAVTGADGEPYGTCLMEPDVSPNGGVFSYCYVDVPFGATVVITADESTLPPGYSPLENPLVVTAPESVGDGIRGPDATFVNVLQDEGAGVQPTVPAATEPAASEPAAEDGSEPVQPTGLPVAVYAGSCADLGQVVVSLGQAVKAIGPAVGQATAVPALVGAATVDVSLDLLIDEDHAVAVVASAAADAPVVACGDVGGVDDDDGVLAIGLPAVDDSGVSGIAYLAYNAADSALTDVSIFLAEGLAGDA